MPRVWKNGKLVEVSEEEAQSLQQKATQQGLPGTPITPVGAEKVGATKDQAKMAGTKAQKQQALKIDVAPEQTLTQAQRLRQPRQQASQEEQKALREAERLERLGSLGSRVDQLIGEQFTQGVQAEQAPTFAVNQEEINQLPDLPTEDKAELNTLLANYQAAVQSEDQAATNQALVNIYDATNEMLALNKAGDVATNYLKGIQESVQQQIPEQIMDAKQVTVGELGTEELGVSPEEMQELFGAGWEQMSIQDLRQNVEDIREEGYTQVQSLQQELADPSSTPARRQEIMQQLRDLSALGISTAEAEMVDLERSIDEAEIVEGLPGAEGEEVRLDQMLNDEYISDAIGRYLGLPEDSPLRKQYEEMWGGGFTDWIKNHEDALEKLGIKVESTAEVFDELQEDNQASTDLQVADGAKVGSLDEKIIEDTLGLKEGAFGKWSATDYQAELKQQDWYQELTTEGSTTVPEKKQFLETLNKVPLDSEFGKELRELPRDQVIELMENPGTFRDYVNYRSQYRSLDEMPDEFKNNSDQMLDYLFGEEVGDTNEVESAMNRDRLATMLGLGRGSGKRYKAYKKLFGKDGKITAQEIQEFVKEQELEEADPPSIKDYLKNPDKFDSRFKLAERASPDEAYSNRFFNKVYKRVKGQKKPRLDAKDAKQLARRESDLYNLYNGPYKKLLNKQAKHELNKLGADLADKKVPDLIRYGLDSAKMSDISFMRPESYINSKGEIPIDSGSYKAITKSGGLLDMLDRRIRKTKPPVKQYLKARRDELEKVAKKSREAAATAARKALRQTVGDPKLGKAPISGTEYDFIRKNPRQSDKIIEEKYGNAGGWLDIVKDDLIKTRKKLSEELARKSAKRKTRQRKEPREKFVGRRYI